ncbi:hypothetical protein [Afifella sp. YEN Y35]|uniref:hypothetical protein n=1 Tax=Afifella sp. YEN Y35 TaxID=3388337 RepID=UPI0039DF8106
MDSFGLSVQKNKSPEKRLLSDDAILRRNARAQAEGAALIQATANETLEAGEVSQFIGTINGVPIPPGEMQDPAWTVLGNTYLFDAIAYAVAAGTTNPANMNAYPLNMIPEMALPLHALIPITVQLRGTYTGDPPGPFFASSDFQVGKAGYAYPTTFEYFGAHATIQDEDGELWVKFAGDHDDSGITLFTKFHSFTSSGRIYAINLVNVNYYFFYNGRATQILTTNGNYYFDGNTYPYPDTQVDVTQDDVEYTVEFDDDPGFLLADSLKKCDYLDWRFSAQTYFFYDNAAYGVRPVLLGFPTSWGYYARAAYDDGWAITAQAATPPAVIQSMVLPQWPHNIVGQESIGRPAANRKGRRK